MLRFAGAFDLGFRFGVCGFAVLVGPGFFAGLPTGAEVGGLAAGFFFFRWDWARRRGEIEFGWLHGGLGWGGVVGDFANHFVLAKAEADVAGVANGDVEGAEQELGAARSMVLRARALMTSMSEA